jgi:pseudouridine 5'-phosphatase
VASPAAAVPEFPPVRACLFDMDGLLLDTEDIYTKCADRILSRYGRPGIPWWLKAQMMGVPGSSTGDVFLSWAKLPISAEEYARQLREEQLRHFPEARPLPGVAKLLSDLVGAKTVGDCHPVQIALASSSNSANYATKTSQLGTRAVLDLIPADHRVLGDDGRVQKGRGKPAPDIYLVALQLINERLPEGVPKITPRECLVFEDSVVGVEAGRRAGMRVVWVPHPKLLAEYVGREREVLARRIGLVHIGDEDQIGQLDDGWAEQLPSLEDFPYAKFGIATN